MTFLQPTMLFGLALAAVPVVIHLLNKRRHKTYRWAATMFLVRATQQARGKRKLRHFLILACRVAAVAALFSALSRPLVGGWVSWFGGNRPEAIVLLLDRSASMETSPDENTPAKRTAALGRIAKAVNEFASGSRLVVFDSAGGPPLELVSADALEELPQVGPSETAADMPAMFERAIDYLATAKPGKAEIWVASDMQESNWLPVDGRWQTIRSSYRGLDQSPPIRVLGLTGAPPVDHSAQLINVWRDGADLMLDLEVRRSTTAATLPINVALDGGAAVQESISMSQPLLALRKRINVGDRKEGGWGKIQLAPDLSPADNTIWFTFGPEKPLSTTVVSADRAGRLLALASAPTPSSGRAATILAPEQAARIPWSESRLIIWQAPLPEGVLAEQIQTYLEQGGSVLFFPPAEPTIGGGAFHGMSWSATEDAPTEGKFPVLTWETASGPLANFRDGQPIALDRLFVIKRRVALGDAGVLATYDDGSPAVMRQGIGRGQAVYFSTLPDPRWSDLGSYNVLLPMIERLLAASARFANDAPTISLGDPLPEDSGMATAWEAVDTAAGGNASPLVRAGVYRRGGVLAAVNVPSAEVLPAVIERADLEKMLDGIKVRLFEETVTREQGLAAEIWRAFAVALMFFLFAEALLSLPDRRKTPVGETIPGATP